LQKETSLGIRSQLKEKYFRNSKRPVYLAQSDDPEYRQKAKDIAAYLELPLTVIETGYNYLEDRLVALMGDR
jgi:hypothetical protein